MQKFTEYSLNCEETLTSSQYLYKTLQVLGKKNQAELIRVYTYSLKLDKNQKYY